MNKGGSVRNTKTNYDVSLRSVRNRKLTGFNNTGEEMGNKLAITKAIASDKRHLKSESLMTSTKSMKLSAASPLTRSTAPPINIASQW